MLTVFKFPALRSIVLPLLLAWNFALAQPAKTQLEQLPPEALQSDFNRLHEAILNYHPAPLDYISLEELEALRDEKLKHLTEDMSASDFHIIVRQYLAAVQCGHTIARPSASWYSSVKGKQVLVPFDVYMANDKVYVKTLYTDGKELKPGDQVLEINGRSIQDVLEDMRAIQPRDGSTQSFVEYNVIRYFRTYHLFLYGIQPQHQINAKTERGDAYEVTLDAAKSGGKKTAIDRPGSLVKKLDNDWATLFVDTSTQVAYLDIDGFGSDKYKKFYRQVFDYIGEANPDHLIIDLRNNGGGYFPNGNTLLTYLDENPIDFNFYRPVRSFEKDRNVSMRFFSKMTSVLFATMPDKNDVEGRKTYHIKYKPAKTQYTGQIHVIINGGSFSMSGYVAAHLKGKPNVTFYGSETGGTAYGSNAVLNHVLNMPHSQIRVNIPYYHLSHPSRHPKNGSGVKPDIELDNQEHPRSTDDTVLIEVLDLISKK